MLDIELPVWTIKPNWAEGVLERLSWLTDVLPSTYGTEQRRALRLSPRRSFEIGFNAIDEARSYFELWLHRLGSVEFMLPLFHDRGKLTAAIAPGATVIPFDTTYREFTVGGLAVLIGDGPFVYDKVEIVAMDDNSITISGGVANAWPKGTAIHPLRRSRVSQESAAAALTSRVGQATLEFELNQANDLPDEGEWGVLYNNYPVLLDKPNWREQRDLSFLRNSLLVDNEQGLRALGDDAGRAFTVDTHSRMVRGRADHMAFRQFLYRLRGQQGAIWVPSFSQDFRLSRPASAVSALIDIKKIGYAYTGGAVSGRRHVLIGDTMAEISGTGAAPSVEEERLVLTAPLGAAKLAGSVGSFMDTCRLTQDDIEITHHTDTDGVSECSLSFRAFRDERVAPPIISSPIPAAAQSSEWCGQPDNGSCVDLASFDGWWIKVKVDFTQGLTPPMKIGSYPTNRLRSDTDDNGVFNFDDPAISYNQDGKYVEDTDGTYVYGAEMTFWEVDYPIDLWRNEHDWDFFTQFGAGSATGNCRAMLYYRKWDMPSFVFAPCISGGCAGIGENPPGKFLLGGLFPSTSIFHF